MRPNAQDFCFQPFDAPGRAVIQDDRHYKKRGALTGSPGMDQKRTYFLNART
jgi:hypothetical protein